MSGIFDQIINYSPPLIVSGTVNYKGTWNASTNNPTLNVSPPSSTKGDYYVVSTAGTQFSISFAVGDWIISNGTAWEKVDLTDAVSSVFGRTGAVVGVSTDYSAVGITNTAIGATNPSTGAFTTVTASSTISASNFSGSSSGVNTGDQTTITGNAGSATVLQTSRNIHGGSFNGSADVTNVITGTYGGTGVNNGANTITIAGNVTHAGAFARTFTATATTTLTLPTTGTLATLAGSEALSNKTITASAFNGTVGATTANTGAFTTLSATGTITQKGSGAGVINFDSTSASSVSHTIGSYYNNGVAFAPLQISGGTITSYVSGSAISTLSSTGLAVTGTSTSSDSMRITTNNVYYRGTTSGGAQQIILGIGADDNTAIVSKSGNTIKMDAGGSTVGTFSSTGLAITGTLSTLATNGVNVFESAGVSSVGLQFKTNSTNRFKIETPSASADLAFYAGGTTEVARLSSTGLAVTGQASVTSFTGTSALGVRITGSTSTNDYSGIDFSTTTAAPRARIGAYYSNNGSYLVFGTSNSYGSGITNSALTIDYSGNVSISGALSKGSGSFRIEHPLPEKSATHQLVHSFIEGPQADLIYRGKVTLIDGKASVNIDAAATMTEGTFEVLCREVQCFTTNETGWTAVRGKVTGNILTIEAKDVDCADEISWMVIGERKDPHMMETDWTDDNGKVIVEPLKPVQSIE